MADIEWPSRSLLLFDTFVSIRHGGLRPWYYGVIRGDVNNIGGSRRWLITVTVQLTSLRLVVRSLLITRTYTCSSGYHMICLRYSYNSRPTNIIYSTNIQRCVGLWAVVIDWLLSTHADRQGVGISFTVCFFVCACTVMDFSTEDKASGVTFWLAVHRPFPRPGITNLCELCSQRSPKSDESASARATPTRI